MWYNLLMKKSISEKKRKQILEAARKSALARKGKKLSKEHKEKISKAYDYAKYVSPERNKKISQSLKGRKWTDEQRKAKSDAMKGSLPDHLMRPEVIAKRGRKRRGSNSNFWKDGRTKLVRQIKNLGLYKQWRKAVFERDNYTCQICDIRGSVELCPDHIKPFSHILDDNKITTRKEAEMCEELWNVDNGRTLCHECHKKTDTYGFKSARK